MSLADTYLVTDKLQTCSNAEVSAAEVELGTMFPAGYREFVTTLGMGDYCGFVRMYDPAEIVKSRSERQSQFTEYAHQWENGFEVLSKERLRECIVIGASIDADLIAFHPDIPGTIYELPRHNSTIYKIGTCLDEALAWYRQERLRASFSYFESYIDRQDEPLPAYQDFRLDELREWLLELNKHSYLEQIWRKDTSSTIPMYLLLREGQIIKPEGRQDTPELSEVTAFYKSFGGYVSASSDEFGRVSARIVHDADSKTDLLQNILDYLRSKSA